MACNGLSMSKMATYPYHGPTTLVCELKALEVWPAWLIDTQSDLDHHEDESGIVVIVIA